MAVSVASVITPQLWKGEPRVVIRGRFSLGLVSSTSGSDNKLHIAPFLYLGGGPGAAWTAAGSGLFSVQVEGRNGNAASFDGSVYDGLGNFSAWAWWRDHESQEVQDYQQAHGSGTFPGIVANPYSIVYPAYSVSAAGLYGGLQVITPLCSTNHSVQTEDDARYYHSAAGYSLGSVVAQDVKITIRGRAANLDLTKIRAAGFYVPGNGASAELATNTVTSLTSDSSTPTGWHPLDVHIYDSPWLRGHVADGGVPVIWG